MKKAFDSITRNTLWQILHHYGIPSKFVNIIRELYNGCTSCVVDGGRTSEWFAVETGVKQGCVLSGFLFNIVIDWIMRSTNNRKRGIRWNFTTTLEDLDYADDIALLSSKLHDLQEKTTRLCNIAKSVGLHINTKKTNVMRLNTKKQQHVQIEGNEIQDVSTFTYLGAVLDNEGGTGADIRRRMSLARTTFAMLRPVWKSTSLSIKTKLHVFNSNVMSVLLYCSEMWRITSADEEKVDVFQRTCLRRILKIYWPTTISNEELYKAAQTKSVSNIITRRRWQWIGHVLRRERDSNMRVALTWTPEGKRKQGRPKNTWRRTVEAERKALGWSSWREVEIQAKDRNGWRKFLCSLTLQL